jgi:hypothetical protein
MDDDDWLHLSAFFEAHRMAFLVLAEELIERGVIDRRSLVQKLSNKVQSMPADDPREAMLQRILLGVAEETGSKAYPKHRSRGPQKR